MKRTLTISKVAAENLMSKALRIVMIPRVVDYS